KESAMSLSERAQRAIERIQEDERLRGDLEDSAATELVAWASEQAAAADNETLSDEEYAATVTEIRTAARKASRSGELEAGQIRKLAQEALSGSAPEPAGTLRKVGQEQPSALPVVSEQPEKPQPTPIDPQQLGALVKDALGSPSTSEPAAPTQSEQHPTRVKD